MVPRTTLKDVARLAGVSTATVARVLHNNGYVAPVTRQKVEDVLAGTGYQINAIAQGLRRQRTFTIGLVLHSIVPNQFFASVAVGVEEIATQHGCGVLMINTHGDTERERSAVGTLIQRRVDAILFTTASHVDNVRTAVNAGVPVVQVERLTEVETPAVTADNFGGAYGAAEHLIHLGHRRIAFIGVDPAEVRSRRASASHPDVEQDRLSGYLCAMRDYQVPVDERLIGMGANYTSGADTENNLGYQWMTKFLDVSEPPTAVFTTFDLFASGVLQALNECGLRVPGDISVVGFDDTYARYLAPPLTTVVHPMEDMGRAAADMVFQMMDKQAVAPYQFVTRLSMQLRVRESTAPPTRMNIDAGRRLTPTTLVNTTPYPASTANLAKSD